MQFVAMKTLHGVGARPNFMKATPILRERKKKIVDYSGSHATPHHPCHRDWMGDRQLDVKGVGSLNTYGQRVAQHH